MKRFRYLGILVFAVLTLVLSACGGVDPNTSLWTEKKFGNYIDKKGKTVSAIMGQNGKGAALAALAKIPAGAPVGDLSALANPESLKDSNVAMAQMQSLAVAGLATLGENNANWTGLVKLPRGKWMFNGNNWELTSNSDDLILMFPFDNFDGSTTMMNVTFDWNAHAGTREVTDGVGYYEVPKGMKIRVLKDGINGGSIDIYAEWYNSSCGTVMLEPSKLSISGHFGHDASFDLSFDINITKTEGQNNNLQAAWNGQNTQIASDGNVSVKIGNDSGSVYWDNTFYGNVSRNANCAIILEQSSIHSGNILFGAKFDISGKKDTIELSFSFDNVKALADNNFAVDFHNGLVEVNGAKVVTFEGTLDNADRDEVPGENLWLTFSDGSADLESFLRSYAGAVPAIDLALPSLPMF
jgi:hypothetical protein